MNINKEINFKLSEGNGKDKNGNPKTFYAIKIVIGQVEKIVAFLTRDQYLLIQSSLQK